MSLFKETAELAKNREALLKEVDELIKDEKSVKRNGGFSLKRHLRENVLGDEAGEVTSDQQAIMSEPKREIRQTSEEPMAVVFYKKEGRWVPTLWRSSKGDIGWIVNRKRDIKKRVKKDDLKPISDKQRQSSAVKKIQQKYPGVALYIYAGDAQQSEPTDWGVSQKAA